MTASTDIAVRASAELVPACPMTAHAAALGDVFLSASVAEFLATMAAMRRAWEEQISAALPCTSLDDDDLFVDDDSWTSPMAGQRQEPVAMNWAVNWGQSGRAA